MKNREDGLIEIYERIKANREFLGITTFKRTPTSPVQEEQLPCIVMLEDTDSIIEYSKRNGMGYPARRSLEVILEIITDKDADIKTLYQNLRRVVFTKRDTVPMMYTPIVAENTFINENRTEGPLGYGLPDVLGMRFILDLIYTDDPF